MLSNRYISEIMPQELTERYSEMEADMLIALAAMALVYKEARYGALSKAMNELSAKLDSIVSRNWPGVQKDLLAVIEEAGLKGLMTDEKVYNAAVAAGLLGSVAPISQSFRLKQIMQMGYASGIGTLAGVNTTVKNVVLSTLNQAFIMTYNGAMTLQQSIRYAVEDMAARGITAAIFPSGRKMEMGAYVRMVTKTTVMKTTNQLCMERASEYGSDLVQVSAHAGARPRCAPFQGRIYSLKGNHPRFPAFSITSYGEIAGLLGINCGHFLFPFIEGLDRMPTAEELDPAKYDLGKSNEQVYNESQQQRYNERKIREWKRRAEALEAAGVGNKRAMDKVRYWQGRQRELMGDTDRTRRYYREAA